MSTQEQLEINVIPPTTTIYGNTGNMEVDEDLEYLQYPFSDTDESADDLPSASKGIKSPKKRKVKRTLKLGTPTTTGDSSEENQVDDDDAEVEEEGSEKETDSEDEEEEEGNLKKQPPVSLEGLDQVKSELVVKRGWLKKRGEKNKRWKKKFFVLRRSKLAYYKDSKEYQVLRIIELEDIHAIAEVKLKRRQNVFGIVTKQKTFFLQCKDRAEFEVWLSEVRRLWKDALHHHKTTNVASETASEQVDDSEETEPTAICRSPPTTTTAGTTLGGIKEEEGSIASERAISFETFVTGESSPSSKQRHPRGEHVLTTPISPSQPKPNLLSSPKSEEPADSTIGIATTLTQTSISPPQAFDDKDKNYKEHASTQTSPTSITLPESSSSPIPSLLTTPTATGTSSRQPHSGSPLLNVHTHLAADKNYYADKLASASTINTPMDVAIQAGLTSGTVAGAPLTNVDVNDQRLAVLSGDLLTSSSDEEMDYDGQDNYGDDDELDISRDVLYVGPSEGGAMPPKTQTGNDDDVHYQREVVEKDDRVLVQGYLYKLGGRFYKRVWKKRWFVLRNGKLGWYKDDKEYVVHRLIPLTSVLDILEIDPISKSHPYCFKVVLPKRTLVISAKTDDDMKRWITSMRSVHERVVRGSVAEQGLEEDEEEKRDVLETEIQP